MWKLNDIHDISNFGYMTPLLCHRYELHQWLVVLHETMEKFKKRKQEEKDRKARKRGTRQRSGSTSESVSTMASTYPRRKPTRKAPPVPTAKRASTGDEGAPDNQPVNENQSEVTPEEDTSNMEAIMADLMASTQELQAAMEFSMTEEEPRVSTANSPEPPLTPPTPTSPEPVAPVFTPAQNSSTPEPNTSTPEAVTNGVKEDQSEHSQGRQTASLEDLSQPTAAPITYTNSGKKRSLKKRSSSVKVVRRSVSPPNVPPPPPPSFEEQVEQPRSDSTDGPARVVSPPDAMSSQKRSSKLLEVMDSYNGIGEELNQIASELSLDEGGPGKSKPPIPARTSSLHPQEEDEHKSTIVKQTSAVHEYLDEAFEDQDNRLLDGEKSASMEVLVDTPMTERESVPGGAGSGSPGILRKGGKTGKKGQVGFQDSTQTYEPRIDQESLPVSVADAKEKLFGERDAKRFKRPLIQAQQLNTNNNNGDEMKPSLEEKTPPLPTLSTADGLLQSIESALQTTSYMEHQNLTTATEENTYESPWDKKPAARFGLTGSRGGGVSFSAELSSGGRRGGSLERRHRTAVSPPPRFGSFKNPAPSSARSVENIVGRSATFSAPSTTKMPIRSGSLASELERDQQQQQWLHSSGHTDHNGFPQAGRKQPPPVAPKKKPTSNFHTLPNWSQLKSSGTQVSYNASMQSTVYRSLV